MNLMTVLGITIILVLPAGQLFALPIAPAGQVLDTIPVTVTDPAERYYQEGLEHLVAGDLDRAQQAFQNSLRESPGLSRSMLGLAEVAFKQNKLEEAGRWIHQAAEQTPDDPHVQTSLGRLLYLQGDYTGAESAFLKALTIDPDMISTRIALADMYLMATRQPDKAIKAYRKALENSPEHAGARYALGMALLANGEPDKAQTELLTASRLEPNNPLPYSSLGNIAVSQQKFEEGLGYYNKALAIDPKNIETLLRRGDNYQNIHKDNLAIQDYEAALAVNDALPAAYLKLGMLYQKREQFGKAAKAYQKTIERNPNSALAYNNLAWMAAESGRDLDQAVVWAKKATELAPEYFGVFDTLAWVYRARKEYDLAISTLQKAVALNPQSTTVFYHLGRVYLEQGNNKQAATALNQVVSLDSQSRDAERAKKLLNTISTD